MLKPVAQMVCRPNALLVLLKCLVQVLSRPNVWRLYSIHRGPKAPPIIS